MPIIRYPDGSTQHDRRITVSLSDEEIEQIAEKAAEKAVVKMTTNMYREVGKGVIDKFFWIIGISAVAMYVYLQQKGIIK